MKILLFLLILINSLNITGQICHSYNELDSLYSNSKYIVKTLKHDTVYEGENIVTYYYKSVANEAVLLFIDSVCYSYTSIYRGDMFKSDDLVDFLNSHYEKQGIYWLGENDEKIDLCYYNTMNIYIITIAHNYILK